MTGGSGSLPLGAGASWILDLDGVVWLAGRPIGAVDRAVEELRRRGTDVRFVTNNSEPTRATLTARLARIGIEADDGAFVTSAQAVASLVLPGERVVLLGAGGVAEAIAERNAAIVDDDIADAVVVGWYPDVSEADIDRAVSAIHRGARFLATNLDMRHPTPGGLVPGTGVLVARVAERSGAEPVVAGKPNRAMVDLVKARLPAGQDLVVVGDQVDTDGKLAIELGARFVLVDSGVTRAGDDVDLTLVAVRAEGFVEVVDAAAASDERSRRN